MKPMNKNFSISTLYRILKHQYIIRVLLYFTHAHKHKTLPAPSTFKDRCVAIFRSHDLLLQVSVRRVVRRPLTYSPQELLSQS